jgi:hypothetical protein
MIQINFLSPDLRGTNQYSNNFEVFLYTKCGLNKNIRFCVPDKFEVRLSGQSNLYKDFLGSLFDLFNNYLNRFCPTFRSDRREMNYPAASYGVSIGNYCNAPRGGESNLYPPLVGLPASGGLVRLGRIEK